MTPTDANHPAQPVALTPAGGRAFSAAGDVYRTLATGEQTGGSHALFEARVPPGGGPPPHIHHREDESFFVLEGEITFTVAGEKIEGKPGSFIQGPRGIPHAFRNESDTPARMLILTTPPGFEHFMEEFSVPLPSFDSPPAPFGPEEIARLLDIAPKYGIELLPPPGAA